MPWSDVKWGNVFFILVFTDKLTKEEEEIYKLQHDLERTAITQQLSQKVSEVSNICLLQLRRSSTQHMPHTTH